MFIIQYLYEEETALIYLACVRRRSEVCNVQHATSSGQTIKTTMTYELPGFPCVFAQRLLTPPTT